MFLCPPYINLADYFEIEGRSSNQTFPNKDDFIQLQEVCRDRPWPCNTSLVSFVRLALFLDLHRRELDQTARSYTVLTYADLEMTFTALGYTSDELSHLDLTILGQFVRAMHQIPLWPHEMQEVRYIRNVTDETFQTDVVDASRNKPVLMYFYASWCLPCHIMTPIMEELAIEFEEDFVLAKVYLDGNPLAASIRSEKTIPALVFYRDGQKASEIFGVPPLPENVVSPYETPTLVKDILRGKIRQLLNDENR